jgi:hypothetical protein
MRFLRATARLTSWLTSTRAILWARREFEYWQQQDRQPGGDAVQLPGFEDSVLPILDRAMGLVDNGYGWRIKHSRARLEQISHWALLRRDHPFGHISQPLLAMPY